MVKVRRGTRRSVKFQSDDVLHYAHIYNPDTPSYVFLQSSHSIKSGFAYEKRHSLDKSDGVFAGKPETSFGELLDAINRIEKLAPAENELDIRESGPFLRVVNYAKKELPALFETCFNSVNDEMWELRNKVLGSEHEALREDVAEYEARFNGIEDNWKNGIEAIEEKQRELLLNLDILYDGLKLNVNDSKDMHMRAIGKALMSIKISVKDYVKDSLGMCEDELDYLRQMLERIRSEVESKTKSEMLVTHPSPFSSTAERNSVHIVPNLESETDDGESDDEDDLENSLFKTAVAYASRRVDTK